MKEFKSIITHPEGQNLFPGQITGIEGYPHGTAITMQNTKPQIALTSYGASYMQPNMDYKFLGDTVFELPVAQMGGQDQQQQLMQIIQVYAQMKGMKPEELIQKIQSLPKEQQQQAIQSIAQEVQTAMAQQQQAQQQGAMGQEGQEETMDQEEMPMAQDGKQTGTSFWDKVVNQYNKTMYQVEDAVDQLTPYLVHQSIYGKSPKPVNWKKVGNDIGTGINNFIKTSPIGVMLNTPIPGLSEYSSQEQQLEEGGEPCFGCFDKYNPSPQAQDLNWFYKKEGGPFSAANMYPEDWASYSGNQYKGGGEAFPAAVKLQDWFGGDRSFMFAEGGGLPKHQAKKSQVGTKGQQIQKVLSYPEIQKALLEFGIDDSVGARIGRYIDNPNGKRGRYVGNADNTKEFILNMKPGLTPEDYSSWSLDDALNTTRLKGWNQPTYGPTKYDPYNPEVTNIDVNNNDNTYRYQPIEQYIIKNNTDTIPFRKEGGESDQYGGQSDIDAIYNVMKKGGINYNPKKKKGGKFNHLDEFNKYLQKGGGLKKYQAENSITGDEPRRYIEGIGSISPAFESEYCIDEKCSNLQGYFGTDKTEEEWKDYFNKYQKEIEPNYSYDYTKNNAPIYLTNPKTGEKTDIDINRYMSDGEFTSDMIARNDLIENRLSKELGEAQKSGNTAEINRIQNDLMNIQHQGHTISGEALGIYPDWRARKNETYDYFTNPQNQPSVYLNGVRTPYNTPTVNTPAADEDLQPMAPRAAQQLPMTNNEIDLPTRSKAVPFNNQIPLSLQDQDYMNATSGQYFNTPGNNVPYNQTLGPSGQAGFRDPNTDRYTYEDDSNLDSESLFKVTDNKTGKVSYPKIGSKASAAIKNIDPYYNINVSDAPTYDYSKIAGNPLPAPSNNQYVPTPGSSTGSSGFTRVDQTTPYTVQNSPSAGQYGNYVPTPVNYMDQTASGDNGFDWNKYGRGWFSKKGQRDFEAGTGKGWGTEYQKPISAADQLRDQEKQMKKYIRRATRRNMDFNPMVDDMNMRAAMTGNKGLFGALAAVGNLGRTVSDVTSGWSRPGRRFEDGGELDKYQAWMSQTNNNWQHSDTPMSTFALPQSMRYNSAFDNYLKSHPMASRDAFDASNTTTNTQGQDYSFNPGSTADPNYAKFSAEGKFDEPVYTPTSSENKESKGWNFDFQRAERDVAGLGQVASYIRGYKQRNSPDRDRMKHNMYTSEFMNVAQIGGGQYGDWSTNATQGTSFRPDEMVYAQKMGRPYKDINVFDYPEYMFKSGGSILDKYDEDGEYDLSQEEINQILAAGGTIEYL